MTSEAGQLLIAQYRSHQLAIRAQMVLDMHRIWSTWTDTSKEGWLRMVGIAAPVIQARAATAAGVASKFFSLLSAFETGQALPGLLPTHLSVQLIERTLGATSLTSVFNGRSRGLSMQAAKQIGFVRASGSASRLVLNGGRDAITMSAQNAGKGYTRVTSGGACDFCAGLEGEHSGAEAFPAHDHCGCVAAPTF